MAFDIGQFFQALGAGASSAFLAPFNALGKIYGPQSSPQSRSALAPTQNDIYGAINNMGSSMYLPEMPAPSRTIDGTPTHPGIVRQGVQDPTPPMVKRLVEPYHGGQSQPQNTPLPSLEEALARAKSLLGASGWNPGYIDVNSISWDPLRQDARSRADEYDAKVAAMYSQLQNQVRTKDAQAIQQNFQQNRDAVKGSTDRTVNEIQQASNAADQRNTDNLAALGLGDAAARIVAQGRDLNTGTAQSVADALARGQVAENAVSRKQQASGDANTQMAGVYGLQGAETRDNIQSQLSALLANYAMSEQQARAQAQQQNASLSQNEQSVLMNLANGILGNDWNTIKYNDSLSQQQLQAAQAQAQAQQKANSAAQVQQMLAKFLSDGGDINKSPAFLPFLSQKQ